RARRRLCRPGRGGRVRLRADRPARHGAEAGSSPMRRRGADRPASEGEEQFAAEHPAEDMRRREFLARTAAIAGAAGLASVLPVDALVSAGAKRQVRAAYPSPRNLPIDHFVVLMMENRSFDHYLGWLPAADGRQAGLKYPDEAGKLHPTHPLAPDFQG